LLYFSKNLDKNLYELIEEKSFFHHDNHAICDKVKSLVTSEIKNYINEKILKSKYTASTLMELVNDKFSSNFDYQIISNYINRVNKQLFGSPSNEFNNMLKLLEEMKKSQLDYHYEYKCEEGTLVHITD